MVRGFVGVSGVVKARRSRAMRVHAGASLAGWVAEKLGELRKFLLSRSLWCVLDMCEQCVRHDGVEARAPFHPARPPRYGALDVPNPQNTKQPTRRQQRTTTTLDPFPRDRLPPKEPRLTSRPKMDQRRPIRPSSTARRGLFNNTTSRRHPHPNPLHSTSSLQPSHATSSHPSTRPTIPIAPSDPDPAADLVERDSAGNYKISAPITAMKMGSGGAGAEDEEVEQENQMIALYGKENCHWDQAGEFAASVS